VKVGGTSDLRVGRPGTLRGEMTEAPSGSLVPSKSTWDRAYRSLARRDRVLAEVIAEYGRPPPFQWHDGGRTGSSRFAAMLLHVVGQQISAVAAFTIFDRIATAARGGVPTAAMP
jgi:3-methyladenine DNA glycosylase/8-oxoguanine DNA glycosylase